ncbi:methyltransferase of ATP-grasp peptide maturase system [Labedaea rhizosphaerae]|uniref:Protein-L-isoaspartate O-methyltransferase n=1 Tax=Labedaea rhizosphaerae TaxID=598644 RepID=A0A4R6SM29_LABRH|nr:methyltransferase of ATP-grasp peptide maturase system [Labedaea rhizosphaerae]
MRTLRRDGALTDPRWITAFLDVPRHVFLPRWFEPEGGKWRAVDDTEPGWLDEVYSDRVLVTQLDNDPESWERAHQLGVVPGAPTSSSSQPGIMAVMLEALQVRDGDRTLEIGTGTGYNAALLCHRLGDPLVSTVDVDASIVAEARAKLDLAGYRPTCVAADGADGLAERAPFDRVLATCSVARIPPPWLAQTTPGGLVVTTLNRPIGAGLVRVTAGEGATGTGRVLAQDGRFMPLRAQQWADEAPADRTGVRRPTAISATEALQVGRPFEFFAGLALSGVRPMTLRGHIVLLHPDGSFAVPGESTVFEGGPRKLWSLVEQAYEQWLDLDRPTRDRFGITVDGDDQYLWLDSPRGPRWPL